MTPQTPKTFAANGLTFAYLEAGPEDGPLVLCAHGFPDTPDTWFHEVAPALAARGYHVVAPWMRGYAPTQIPADGDYGSAALGRDVVGWIDAFGAERAVLIGHDWGAHAVYCALGTDASRISAAITVDIPHPNALKPRLGLLWGLRHFVAFQARGHAVRWISRDGFANIDTLHRRWSPTWDFTPADTAAAKACFAHEGVPAAALGYYWSFVADQRGARGAQTRALFAKPVTPPLLCFAGTTGPVATPADFERARRFCQDRFEVVTAEGAGHWIHREQPQLFIERVLAFLDAPSLRSAPPPAPPH